MINKTIKAQRQLLGLTQQKLAHLSGLSLATIQNIEADKANPEWETILVLLKSLKLSVQIERAQINWNELAEIGVPLFQQDPQLTYVNKQDILDRLNSVIPHLKNIKITQREGLALFSYLLALRDHYSSFYKTIPQILKKWLAQNINLANGEAIKLRRIASQRLAQIL